MKPKNLRPYEASGLIHKLKLQLTVFIDLFKHPWIHTSNGIR